MMKSLPKGLLWSIPMLLLLIGVAYLYHYYFEKHDYPYFKQLDNVRFEQINLQPKMALGFQANAVFHNPSPLSINITGVYCQIFIDGKASTTVLQQIEQRMPAHSDFSLPLSFEIPIGNDGFFKDLGQVLSGAWKNRSVEMRTVGTIGISIAQMDLEVPFEQKTQYHMAAYLK